MIKLLSKNLKTENTERYIILRTMIEA